MGTWGEGSENVEHVWTKLKLISVIHSSWTCSWCGTGLHTWQIMASQHPNIWEWTQPLPWLYWRSEWTCLSMYNIYLPSICGSRIKRLHLHHVGIKTFSQLIFWTLEILHFFFLCVFSFLISIFFEFASLCSFAADANRCCSESTGGRCSLLTSFLSSI